MKNKSHNGITIWHYNCKACGEVGCLTVVKRQHLSKEKHADVMRGIKETLPQICLFKLKDKEPLWELISENQFNALLQKSVSDGKDKPQDRFSDLDVGDD